MNKIIILYIVTGSLLYSDSCIVSLSNRNIVRNEYTFHERIESDHFVVHFTTSNVDSQQVFGNWYNLQSNFGYAQSIIDHLESAYSIYLSKGWESIPPDCDESISNIDSDMHCDKYGGNALYDIYISNDGAGMVVPENPYPVEPYIGGYSSFMKISTLLNEFSYLPSWSYHVIAHELHHAIQLRYGYSVSGSPGDYMYNGWLFEQTATYMQNVIYPNSNHLSTMLANCEVTTPLTYPDLSIDHGVDIYQYRSALWQKYMVESFGDSSIVRYIWEDYGTQYGSGAPVYLFPIYNNAIKFVTDNEIGLTDAYKDYAVWRYFTGDRSLPMAHFYESHIYCESSIAILSGNLISFPSEKGAAQFIQLPFDAFSVSVESQFENILQFQYVKGDGSVNDINLNNNTSFYLNNTNDEIHALIITSSFTGAESENIDLYIELNDLQIDLNNDENINIVDLILLVDMILYDNFSINADINNDNLLNVLDVIIYINIILST
tara:strand:- start:1683 stop:3155 length:1473 start_codon:yes stop_codon:yes gene_type:complete